MIVNKVVVRFKDGTLMKGRTNDFSPDRERFHLELLNNEVVNINIEKLKAVFFVKDLKGDKNRRDMYDDVIAGGGKKIKVQFFDGEVIIGYTLSYSPKRQGFFIVPADRKSNNERIFVINSATEKIEFL
jgi:hypothetical protein